MKSLIILILLTSCSTPVFLSKKSKTLKDYHDLYIKKWERTNDYHLGFYKMDLYSFGVCIKGKNKKSTEVLVNQRKWKTLSEDKKKQQIEFLLNFCFYKKYNHNKNVHYFN